MNLSEICSSRYGVGILSTADSQGRVDAAIYSRPKVIDEKKIVFIMRERLTYKNLQENPHAAYLFMEKGEPFSGVRLFLKKIGEDSDIELINQMTRRNLTPEEDLAKGPKHLLYFSVEKVLPLVGAGTNDTNP